MCYMVASVTDVINKLNALFWHCKKFMQHFKFEMQFSRFSLKCIELVHHLDPSHINNE